MPAPGTEIDRLNAVMSAGVFERRHMARGEVAHVDIIADAGAVGRVVIIAEDHELLAPPHRHLGDEGDEVVGDAAWVLADLARDMGADGVEIAEQRHRFLRVGRGPIVQDFLDEIFCFSVGIDGGKRVHLIKGKVMRLTIDGGRGRKNNLPAANRVHGFQELDCAEDVFFVIGKRFLLGLADGFKSGKMDHGVGPEIFDDPADSGAVGKAGINVIEGAVRETGHALKRYGRGIGEIIHHHRRVIRRQKLKHGVRADISRPAGDQHAHLHFPYLWGFYPP